jgi:hypothetical protein
MRFKRGLKMMLECGPITVSLSLLDREERLPSLHVDVGIQVRRLSHFGSCQSQLWFEARDWNAFVEGVGRQSNDRTSLYDISHNFELEVDKAKQNSIIKIRCSTPQNTEVRFKQECEWLASAEEVEGLYNLFSSIS